MIKPFRLEKTYEITRSNHHLTLQSATKSLGTTLTHLHEEILPDSQSVPPHAT